MVFFPSMPAIEKSASSMGSTTSRSTVSGEAPGYGMPTTTMGCWMSGNSSVLRRQSENSPNTTSASITVTVAIGFLMARSEMSTGRPT